MRGLTFGLILTAALSSSCANASCRSDRSDYDFIVVGGGTAGLAVATRLSQKLPNDCILVIEAGPDGREEQRIYVPGLRGTTLGGQLDWALPTVPQDAASNRTITHNRGKVLGGSSALNLLVWNRATIKEFDAWEELGSPGWNWKNMYSNMLKVENFQRAKGEAQYGREGIGYGGPVNAALIENPPIHLRNGILALENRGFRENLQSLNGNNIGTMYQPAANRLSNHTRSYSVDYLPRAGPNLVILFNSTVRTVNLDDNNSKTTGVLLIGGREIRAKKEVIISAGSLLSPKILELSGIGQKDILSKAGIKQRVDLPGVGENLQDHLRIQATYELKQDILGLDILKYNATRAAIELDLWRRNLTSLYQYAGSAYGFTKWDTVLGKSQDNLLRLANQSTDMSNIIDRKKLQFLTDAKSVPDLQLVFSDGYIGTRGYPKNGTAGYGKQYATIIAGVMHPFARGSVHINGSDVATNPIIDPKFLSTPYDLEALKQAAQYLRKISQTPPYPDVYVKEFDPGNVVLTDAQWEKYVRDNVYTFYHPLGSCAMLPKKDGGVVDPSLRVYGVENLRIVDASVIPIIISGNIQTAVYGIAERAATIIVEKYRS
ncbi:GMC oxidoreductase [Melanomma pulvis-pyrius CBS 109.77]|uniref:GMC oxidoreductase n=1 Tax=Melanomma pulvis-pyrius CBS 109.77 TaxID=1314802 RepID=A0A6A6X087_9PLEO|nr:GMC oxidoreductase [Melanomma pulvis-pyrius CBS 109.77]